ncbi:MAG: STAS domain-containing protein [Planctomycetota bacterium]|jgi:anti-anti-sigma factor
MECNIQRDAEIWRIRLISEVRTSDYSALEKTLNDVLDDGAEKVVIDLECVDFLASSIIGVLLEMSARLTSKGAHRMVLYLASKQIKEVISLLFPPDKFFVFADTDEEIKKAFAE